MSQPGGWFSLFHSPSINTKQGPTDPRGMQRPHWPHRHCALFLSADKGPLVQGKNKKVACFSVNFSCSLNIPLHLHQVTLWVSLTHKRVVSQGSITCHTDVINHRKQIMNSNNHPVPARANVTPVPAASPRAFPPTRSRVFKADHRIL